MAMLGLTVDIGTSNIVVRLVSCGDNNPLAERVVPNPQSFAGLDIISRARYAVSSSMQTEKLRLVTIATTDSTLKDIMKRNQVKTEDLGEIVVVGNTVMHHLFYGLELGSLLDTPYIPYSCDPIATTARDTGLTSASSTLIYSPPLIDAFVGADSCANVAAARVWERKKPVLIMDIGVNTELLMWDGAKIWAASVASGPAFESMSLECGAEAAPGAIDGIDIEPDTFSTECSVIDGNKPSGICGSGVISLLSEMLQTGLLNRTGTLNRDSDSAQIKASGSIYYYTVAAKEETLTGEAIYITQPEIRALQLAKSAVAAGVVALLREAEITESQISQVHTTGSFGSSLDIEAARRIGMLPDFENAKHVARDHGASLGAAAILCSSDTRRICEQLARHAQYVDLEHNKYFNEAFPVARLFQSWDSLVGSLGSFSDT